jgi:hypothetical protein
MLILYQTDVNSVNKRSVTIIAEVFKLILARRGKNYCALEMVVEI